VGVRDSLLEEVHRLCAQMLDRTPLDSKVILLSGGPGLGKTYLANEVRQAVRERYSFAISTVEFDLRWRVPKSRVALLLTLQLELQKAGVPCPTTTSLQRRLVRLEKQLTRIATKRPELWQRAEDEVRSAGRNLATKAITGATEALPGGVIVAPLIKLAVDVVDDLTRDTITAFAQRLLSLSDISAEDLALVEDTPHAIVNALCHDLAVSSLDSPILVAIDTAEVAASLLPWFLEEVVLDQDSDGDIVWLISGQWLDNVALPAGRNQAVETYVLEPFTLDQLNRLAASRWEIDLKATSLEALHDATMGIPLLVDYLLQSQSADAWEYAVMDQSTPIHASLDINDPLRRLIQALLESYDDEVLTVVTLLALARESIDSPHVLAALRRCDLTPERVLRLPEEVALLKNGRLHDLVEKILRRSLVYRRGPLANFLPGASTAWHAEVAAIWQDLQDQNDDIFSLYSSSLSADVPVKLAEAALWTNSEGAFGQVTDLYVQALAPNDLTSGDIVRILNEFGRHEHRNVLRAQLTPTLLALTAGKVCLARSSANWYLYRNTPLLLDRIVQASENLQLAPLTRVMLMAMQLELQIRRRNPPSHVDEVIEEISRPGGEARLAMGYVAWLVTSWAKLQASSGDVEQAAETVGRLLDVEPLGARSLIGIGELLDTANQHEKAAAAAEQALSRAPFDPTIVVAAARIFIHSNRHQLAIEAVSKALTANPSDRQILYQGIYAAISAGAFSQAARWAQKYHESAIAERAGQSAEELAYSSGLLAFATALAISSGEASFAWKSDREIAIDAVNDVWTRVYFAVAEALQRPEDETWHQLIRIVKPLYEMESTVRFTAATYEAACICALAGEDRALQHLAEVCRRHEISLDDYHPEMEQIVKMITLRGRGSAWTNWKAAIPARIDGGEAE
jgi:tetratricopeptide (TPR) repeat protein